MKELKSIIKEKDERVIITSSLISLAFGVWVGVFGLILPDIETDYNLNHTMSALFNFVRLFPGLIASIWTGYVFRGGNRKLIMLVTGTVLLITTIIQSFVHNYWIFLFGFAVVAFCYSIQNIGSHIFIPDIYSGRKYPKRSKIIMIIHFTFALGNILSPVIAMLIINKLNMGWEYAYLIAGIIYFIPTITILFFDVPPSLTVNKLRVKEFIQKLLQKKVFLLSICISLYVGAELGITTWFVTFLEKGFGFDKDVSSLYIFIFFIALTAGRLSGTFLINRFNPYKQLITLILGSTILLSVGIFFRIFILISLTGFTYSMIFPLIQILMLKSGKDENSISTGMILFQETIGIGIYTFVIGWFNDIVGVRYGLSIIIVMLMIIIPIISYSKKLD